MSHTAYINEADAAQLQISSPAFEAESVIPEKYTCDGANISPPLDIKDIPAGTACLALIMDDPDAPVSTWTHWLAWNIPVKHHLKEHYIPAVQGINDFNNISYGGPCPPRGAHRYYFRVFAMDRLLDLSSGANRQQMEIAMAGHILAKGELMGYYTRKKR